ncbi:MAG: 50S ribosomal protein L11 methyltransferase [Pyrinomonadaceae bacterium]
MSNKQEKWFSVEIETESGVEEAVEFALNELDSLGNEIQLFGKKKPENITVIGYFNERINDTILRVKLNECLEIYGFSNDVIKKIEWREIENQDWLAEWKKHWRPTETEKFIIAATWAEVENTGKIIIRIEPSMAFGTGTHETTRLCLKAIEDNYKAGETFLDVGTGTGILAIAVAKQCKVQSAKCKVVGCDTDFDAITIAIKNAELNNTKNIEFYVGSISENTAEFDFVCANLTADVIVPLLPLLVEKSNRILVLSGILKEQENLIVEELKKFKIENPKIETDGEWISVTVGSGSRQ